jgi:hypothetical protein
MIEVAVHLKYRYGLKTGVISNETREVNEYRICRFKSDRENTLMGIEVAEGSGIQGVLHADYRSTRAKSASFGL